MSERSRARAHIEPERTGGGRVMAALASLLFSVPLAGLFWLLFNIWLAGTDAHMPAWPCVAFVTVLAGLAFQRPRLATGVLGGLAHLFFKLGRYW